MSLEEIDLHNDNLFNTIKQTLAMIVFDIHGQILWANDKFSNVVGYDVEELTKMHHRELCTNTFRNSEEYTTFWRHLQENKAFHDKVERVQKNGEIVWLDAMYTPVVNESGHVESVIKIASDITKQESVLKKSSTEYIALVEKMTASTDDVHAVSIQASKDMDVLEQESISLEACIDTAWTSSVLAVIFSTNAINSVELFFKTDSCLVISEAILMTLSTCPDSFTTGVYMASSQTISPFF